MCSVWPPWSDGRSEIIWALVTLTRCVIEHHVVLFVLQAVAVKNELARMSRERDEQSYLFSRHYQHGVLNAPLRSRERATSADTVEDPKSRAMYVHRVDLISAGIIEFPDFRAADPHVLVDALGDRKSSG